MADIVQKRTEYRIKQIELAEAKYYKTLTSTYMQMNLIETMMNH